MTERGQKAVFGTAGGLGGLNQMSRVRQFRFDRLIVLGGVIRNRTASAFDGEDAQAVARVVSMQHKRSPLRATPSTVAMLANTASFARRACNRNLRFYGKFKNFQGIPQGCLRRIRGKPPTF